MESNANAQIIADLTAESIHLPKHQWPQVRVKNVQAGRALLESKAITIPTSAFKKGDAYATYYIVHEVCHFLESGHGPVFKRIERRALKYWGLRPKYTRAYPKQIMTLSGDVVYKR